MSLFGSGRGDGFLAGLALILLACALSGLTLLLGLESALLDNQGLSAAMTQVHLAVTDSNVPLWHNAGLHGLLSSYGAEVLYPPWWLLGRGTDELWLPILTTLHAALACVLTYRLLRAHGRSRYAAFIGGAIYGLGAFAASLHGDLTELAAMAWAPLPIAILLRVVRGERHRRQILWLGPTMALPVFTGGTVTACLAMVVVFWWLLSQAISEPQRRRHLLMGGLASLFITACLTAPIWLSAWTATTAALPLAPELDWALTRQRLAGPLLVFLVLLGVLRSQREAPPWRWLPGLALAGLLAVWMPYAPWPLPGPAPWQIAPNALWWPVHLLLILFATSSLDDFLDLPARRRSALTLTILLAIAVAPFGWWYATAEQVLLIEVAGMLTFAALFATWRRLGMPRFKAALACSALAWLSLVTLYEPSRPHHHAAPPAAPATETLAAPGNPVAAIIEPEQVMATGGILAACGGLLWGLWLLRSAISGGAARRI